LPFPYTVAVAAAVAYVYALARRRDGVDDWLASYGTRENIELDPSTKGRLRQFFVVYGCNGTEFVSLRRR